MGINENTKLESRSRRGHLSVLEKK